MTGEPIDRRSVLSAAGAATLFVGGVASVPESARADEPAEFDVEIVDTGGPFVWGGELRFTVRVTNRGERDGSQTLRYEVAKVGAGRPFAKGETGVSLDGEDWDGYDSTEETFTVDTEFNSNDRRVLISAVTHDTSDTERVMMEATKRPEFDVTIDTEELGTVVEGEELSVPVEIENLGHMPDVQTIGATFDGSDVGSQEIELHWRETTSTTFTVPTEHGDSGEHEIAVSSDDTTDTVEISVLEAAFFDVDDVQQTETIVGDDLTVTVELTNTGEDAGSKTVVLDVDGVGTREQDVSIDPGETVTGEFTLGTEDAQPGVHTGSVDTTDTSHTVELELEEPALELADVAVETPVEEGEDVVVEITLENPSVVEVSEEVTIAAGDLGEESVTVDVAEGDSVDEEIEFATEQGDEGEYVAEVSTELETEEVEFVVEAASDAAEGADSEETDDAAGPGFGIGAGITGAAGAAYLAKKRLQDTEE